MYCDLLSSKAEELGTMYEVRDTVKLHRGGMQKMLVSVLFWSSDLLVECSCHLFEFKIILCRHAIMVLVCNEVESVPEKYIVRTWRKYIKHMYSRVKVSYDGLAATPSQERYDELCLEFSKLADLAADDESDCHKMKMWISSRKLEMRNRGGRSKHARNHVGQDAGQEEADTTIGPQIKDPKHVRTKGARRKVRKNGPLESGQKKATGRAKLKKARPVDQETSTDWTTLDQPTEQQMEEYFVPMQPSELHSEYPVWDVEFGVGLIPNYSYDYVEAPGRRYISSDGVDITEVVGSSNMPRF